MQENGDVAGWIFLFFHGGWLKRGWKKRWCTLRDGKMFLYKHKVTNNSNNTDNTSKAIDLKYYRKCLQATQNECKKHPNTLVLELFKPGQLKDKSNQKNEKLHSELFYIVNENEKDRWLAKLNEAISKIQKENRKNLDHVTKFRAKPSAVTRRPPTRKHLRDVATQSQLISGMDFNEVSKTEINGQKQILPPTEANLSRPEAGKQSPNVQIEIFKDKSNENPVSLPNAGHIGLAKCPADSPCHNVSRSVDAAANDNPTVVVTSPQKQSQTASPIASPIVTPTHSLLSSANPRILQIKKELQKNGRVYNRGLTNLSFMAIDEHEKTDDDWSRTSSPVFLHSEQPSFTEDSNLVRSTTSLDRRNFDHNNENCRPTLFGNKHRRTSETTVLLKARALQAHIKFPMLKVDNPPIHKSKSKSMPLLDNVDNELPPPPELPPNELIADGEVTANRHNKKRKKYRKSKKHKQS